MKWKTPCLLLLGAVSSVGITAALVRGAALEDILVPVLAAAVGLLLLQGRAER